MNGIKIPHLDLTNFDYAVIFVQKLKMEGIYDV